MSNANAYERYMLDLINAERAAVGAPSLELEQNLNASAEDHSEWMLRMDVFSHTGVGGSSPTQRMENADFDFSGSWQSAENISIQSERGAPGIMDDVKDLHESLMASDGHRANILDPNLDYIGIGIEQGEFDFDSGTFGSVIVTQNFASTGGSVDLDDGGTGALTAGNTDGAPSANAPTGEPGDSSPIVVAGPAEPIGGTGNDMPGVGRDDDLLLGGREEDVFVPAPREGDDIVEGFQPAFDTRELTIFDIFSPGQLAAFAPSGGWDLLLALDDGGRLRLEDSMAIELTDDVLL